MKTIGLVLPSASGYSEKTYEALRTGDCLPFAHAVGMLLTLLVWRFKNITTHP